MKRETVLIFAALAAIALLFSPMVGACAEDYKIVSPAWGETLACGQTAITVKLSNPVPVDEEWRIFGCTDNDERLWNLGKIEGDTLHTGIGGCEWNAHAFFFMLCKRDSSCDSDVQLYKNKTDLEANFDIKDVCLFFRPCTTTAPETETCICIKRGWSEFLTCGEELIIEGEVYYLPEGYEVLVFSRGINNPSKGSSWYVGMMPADVNVNENTYHSQITLGRKEDTGPYVVSRAFVIPCENGIKAATGYTIDEIRKCGAIAESEDFTTARIQAGQIQ